MRLRKKILSVLLSAAMVVTMANVPTQNVKTAQAASSSFNNLNQAEITAAMGAGWNLGNQLESAIGGTPSETAWGNPTITEDLILAVKDAGFKSIRIPVSYLSKIGSAPNYTIDSAWLDRVQEVVDMCIDNGLYAIVNMHGDGYYTIDGGWLLCGSGNQTQIKQKYEACWKQIASRFANYDEHLIFESMNEEFDGTYGNPSSTAYANINAYNQIFVDTVRQSGGNNDKRWLLIPGWNTNINYTADNYGFQMPTDNYLSSSIASGEKRIMVSVHYYDPWDFCGQEDTSATQWGENATNNIASWGDESYMSAQIQKMYNKFVKEGYPVVIGEYGAIDKSAFDSKNASCREEYYKKFCDYCDTYGCIPVAWDNGYNGNYGFGLFDRYNYKVTQQGVIDAIMSVYGDASKPTSTGITLDKTSLTIAIGEGKKQINATLTPAGSTDKIKWSTSDESIATVNSKGQVTAVSVGSCVVTATAASGVSASCKVTVPKPTSISAKLYLLETKSWTSVISDEAVDISSAGGDFSLSLTATDDQLKNIGSLYIRDISVGEEDASAFDTLTMKVNSFEVNGTKYSMKNSTFNYDVNQKASDDGLTNNIFNFSFINVWANNHINNITVESGNYKAYFNNVNYQGTNTVKMNFSISGINGGSTAEPTVAPTATPTVKPTATPTVKPTATPTVKPTATPTVAPTATPTVKPTATPTVKPTATPTVKPTATPTVKPTVAPTVKPGATETVLATNETNKYETTDPAWLLNAADDDVITLTYTCTESSHGNWGIMGWGASVNDTWTNGTMYNAAANASDQVTVTCTAAELKKSMGITASSKVSYLCLSTWNGGKIVKLSVASASAATPTPTVAPTATPTVAPTAAPTATPTVAPTATPTVAPTTAPTTEPTTSPDTDKSNASATLTVTGDWGAGGLGTISITNTTAKTYTEGWSIRFHSDREITACWSGVLTDLGNGNYMITNPGWNGYWAVGDQLELHMQLGSGSASPTLSNVYIE